MRFLLVKPDSLHLSSTADLLYLNSLTHLDMAAHKDITRMVVFNKKKSKVKIFSSEKKLDSYLNKHKPQAKEALRNFQGNPRPNMGANFLEDLEDLELGWRDERERQYNPIAEAAYILRNSW